MQNVMMTLQVKALHQLPIRAAVFRVLINGPLHGEIFLSIHYYGIQNKNV
jgi:hypothetical protein